MSRRNLFISSSEIINGFMIEVLDKSANNIIEKEMTEKKTDRMNYRFLIFVTSLDFPLLSA